MRGVAPVSEPSRECESDVSWRSESGEPPAGLLEGIENELEGGAV